MDWKSVLEFMENGWELRYDRDTGRTILLYPPNWGRHRVHGKSLKALLDRGLIEEWRRGEHIVVYGVSLLSTDEDELDAT